MRVPGRPLLFIASALQALRSAGQFTATSWQWQGPFNRIDPPFNDKGEFRLPAKLQSGCDMNALNRIGLTISATDNGKPLKSPWKENILGVVSDLFLVADVYSPTEFNFCVMDDYSNMARMLDLYRGFVMNGINTLFGPSSGGEEWNSAVEVIARAGGARLFTWSLSDKTEYEINSLHDIDAWDHDFTSRLENINHLEDTARMYFPTQAPPQVTTTQTTMSTQTMSTNGPPLPPGGGRRLASGATEAPGKPGDVEQQRGLFVKRRASRKAPRKPGALLGLSYSAAIRSLTEQEAPAESEDAEEEEQVEEEQAEEAPSLLTEPLGEEPAATSAETAAAGLADEGQKARRLRNSSGQPRLSMVLDLNFDSEWMTLGALTLLQRKSNATGIAFVTWWPDPNWAKERYCQKLKHIVRDYGYTQIHELQGTIGDPTQLMDFVKSGVDPVVVWCTSPLITESLLVITKAMTWEPEMFVFPRPNVVNRVMGHIPAFDLNYNIEPSNWPSIEELTNVELDTMPIYSSYYEWWSWHAAFTGVTPPLMSHQIMGTIQLYHRLLVLGFIGDDTLSTDTWDWNNRPIWTVNGAMRFDDNGLRQNATPAVRQLFPWPLDPQNLTLESFERRYYASKSFELVDSKEQVRTKYAALYTDYMQNYPNWPGTIWWFARHPIGGHTEISEIMYPRPRWEEKELEVNPCKTGCQFVVNRCEPCSAGNYRGAQDVICRQCQDPGTYADIKGLGKCRVCPRGATCDKNERARQPVAQPGFYKVDLQRREMHAEEAVVYDDAYWIAYCGLWTDSSNATSSRKPPDRGPLGQGPDPLYVFAACEPKVLCLGANQCIGFNTGVLCSVCKPNFSYRHLRVDTRECEPCGSTAGVLAEMCGVAAIYLTFMVAFLSMSHFEVAIIDSIKAPMLLAMMHHFHVLGFIMELLSESSSTSGGSHLILDKVLTRPFDLMLTDCLLNQYDPIQLIQGLLYSAVVAYIAGLFLCCIARPLVFLVTLMARYMCLCCCCVCCCRRSRKASQKSGEQSEGARQFRQLHEGFAMKIGLIYAMKRCLIWTMLYYPVLVRSAAQVFYCRVFGLDTSRLRMDISITCGDPALNQAKWLSLTILVGFGAGFPFILFLLLRSAVEMDYAMIPMRRYIGIFVGGYKQGFYVWEVLKIMRTYLIICSGIIRDDNLRRALILCVFVAFSFTQVSLEPHNNFHRSALSRTEAISSFSLCIIIVAGWVSSAITQVSELLTPGSFVMMLADWAQWVCDLVERFIDLLFLLYLGRALIFSLIVLPLHIANRTGAKFTPFVRMFIKGGRWLFGCNSVGVVDGSRDESVDSQEMYLYVGALDYKETKVMKRGIGEVVLVAVKNYDKFHPALIVNAMDEAARRAGQARAAISMHRQQMEQHSYWSSLLANFMHERLTQTRAAQIVRSASRFGFRPATTREMPVLKGLASSGSTFMQLLPTWSYSSKGDSDQVGFFTVEELYTSMQDVIMDITDRNPLLKSVGDVNGRKKKGKQKRSGGKPRVEKGDLYPRINTRMRSLRRTEDDESALFERLALEREARIARKRQPHDGSQVKDAREDSGEVDFDPLYKGASQVGMGTMIGDDSLAQKDLDQAVQDREAQIIWLKQRLEELNNHARQATAGHPRMPDIVAVAKFPSTSLSKPPLPRGAADEESSLVAMLKPAANRRTLSLQPRELQESNSDLLSPRNRHVTASGEHQEQAIVNALVRRMRYVQEVDSAPDRGTSPPRGAQPVAVAEPRSSPSPKAPDRGTSPPRGAQPVAVAEPRSSPSPKARAKARARAGGSLGSSAAAMPKSDQQPALAALALPPALAAPAPAPAAASGAATPASRRESSAPEIPEAMLPPAESVVAQLQADGDSGRSPSGSGGGPTPGRSSGALRRRKASWRDKLLAPRKTSERSGPPTIPEDSQLEAASARGPMPPEAFAIPESESVPATTNSAVIQTSGDAAQAQRNSVPNSARSASSASSTGTDGQESDLGEIVPVPAGHSVWSSPEAREALIHRESSRHSSTHDSARSRVPPLQLHS